MDLQIKEIISQQREEVIKSIQEQIRIPSVRNEEDKSEGAPFGTAIRNSLDHLLELAHSFGMRTYADPEGYYGYVEIGPENSKEMIGIVGHVDVVPEGDHAQWNEAGPFSGDIVDDKIIGRGTLDDKGPVVINLYAMKNILDLNIELNKRIRLIVGCAEETTWECMDKYVKLEEKPTLAYSPDGDFPLINAEKTISQMDATTNESVDFEVYAMGAYNAVPDAVSYKGNKIKEIEAELQKLNFEYKIDADKLIVLGKSAHAMANHLGVNSVCRLAMAMYNVGERCKVIDYIAEQVKETTGAELFQGEVKEEVSGVLKYTLSRIDIKDGYQYIGMDTRIPVLVDADKIIKKYEETITSYGLDYKQGKIQKKLYVEEDSFLVQNLLNVYKEVTGHSNAKPVSTGGGTYSRAFDNCVAFGCVFVEDNMIDKMHQPNECFELKFLDKTLEIYTKSLIELLK